MAGILQGSASGETYQANADYWADGAYQADADAAATDAGGEAFLGDLQGGGSMGGSAGIVGGIIGLAVGAIIGIVDAFVTKDAVKADLEKEAGRRQKLEEELSEVMNMRDEIENNLAALMHPLEQGFRTRARLAGAAARASGVTGAQSIAVGLLAEEQYRTQIGPHLPAIMKEARGLAREQAFAELKKIEVREGILLDRSRLQLQQDMAAAEGRSALIGGLAQTAAGIGVGIGIAAGEQGGGQQQGTSDAGPQQGSPVDDIYGEQGSAAGETDLDGISEGIA